MTPAGVRVTGVVKEISAFFNSQRMLESGNAEKFVPRKVTAFSRREGMRFGVRTNGKGFAITLISMQTECEAEPTPMQTLVLPAVATGILHMTADSER
jgi:hypothetical protein